MTSIDEGSAKNILHQFTDKTTNLYIILKIFINEQSVCVYKHVAAKSLYRY